MNRIISYMFFPSVRRYTINISRYRVQMVWETEVHAAFYEYLMHRHTI